jgi:circadian clock protein KaiB
MATQGKSPIGEPSPTRFEPSPVDAPVWKLRLYVAGVTLRSKGAIQNVKAICGEYLLGRCDLQVIDAYQQPDLARRDEIVAAPTLVRIFPPPVRRLVGDLSDPESVLFRLDVSHSKQSDPIKGRSVPSRSQSGRTRKTT